MENYSNFTRKQAGVLYRAFKEGKLEMTDAGVKMIYARADAYRINDSREISVETCLRAAVDAVMGGNTEKAQEELCQAFKEYAQMHGEVAATYGPEAKKEIFIRFDIVDKDGEILDSIWDRCRAEAKIKENAKWGWTLKEVEVEL